MKTRVAGLMAAATVAMLAMAEPSGATAKIFGCGQVSQDSHPERVLITLACLAKSLLQDPEVARFNRLHVVKLYRRNGSAPGWALCGEVTVRDTFNGGLIWQRFGYTDAEHRLLLSTLICEGEPVVAGARN